MAFAAARRSRSGTHEKLSASSSARRPSPPGRKLGPRALTASASRAATATTARASVAATSAGARLFAAVIHPRAATRTRGLDAQPAPEPPVRITSYEPTTTGTCRIDATNSASRITKRSSSSTTARSEEPAQPACATAPSTAAASSDAQYGRARIEDRRSGWGRSPLHGSRRSKPATTRWNLPANATAAVIVAAGKKARRWPSRCSRLPDTPASKDAFLLAVPA